MYDLLATLFQNRIDYGMKKNPQFELVIPYYITDLVISKWFRRYTYVFNKEKDTKPLLKVLRRVTLPPSGSNKQLHTNPHNGLMINVHYSLRYHCSSIMTQQNMVRISPLSM